MNKHAMAVAVCLALQPVIALGVETMNQPGVSERDAKRSFEIQRNRSKQGDVAKSCIPMHPGGGTRNDCEPMTQPRARPDGTRLVHTFPDGARLYATTRNGDIQKYSAIDQRGRALKVEIVQNPQKGMVSGPGDAIQRGKIRAEEDRKHGILFTGVTIEGKNVCMQKIGYAGGFFWYDACMDYAYLP